MAEGEKFVPRNTFQKYFNAYTVPGRRNVSDYDSIQFIMVPRLILQVVLATYGIVIFGIVVYKLRNRRKNKAAVTN